MVEARNFLGGRVFSFIDEETGIPVDNGQHVFLGCCSYYIQFLKRLGAFEKWHLQPRLRVRVFGRTGKSGLLAAARMPAPFHFLPALLMYPHLGPGDKLRVLATLLRIRFTNRQLASLEQISFYQWLKQQRQTEAAIENLWNLLIVPTLNDDVRNVSASMGLMIFQEGILKGRHDADVGYATDGLSPAMGEPAREYLEAQGARLLLGNAVRQVLVEQTTTQAPPVAPTNASPLRVAGIELASGETITGEFYVSALPFHVLLSVLPSNVVDLPFFHRLQQLETSPIVNIHLWYDRPVMEEDFCAFVDGPLQWVFNKSAIMGESREGHASTIKGDRAGQYLCLSISAAWKYIDQPREELARQFIAAMSEAFPAAREAAVPRWVVVKQRHATFRCLPGAAALRPTSQTPIANLFLAGEWTATHWPSTMESAVRSGYNTAQAIAHCYAQRREE
jgi:squalene-associated FAD-dependent desaturase